MFTQIREPNSHSGRKTKPKETDKTALAISGGEEETVSCEN